MVSNCIQRPLTAKSSIFLSPESCLFWFFLGSNVLPVSYICEIPNAKVLVIQPCSCICKLHMAYPFQLVLRVYRPMRVPLVWGKIKHAAGLYFEHYSDLQWYYELLVLVLTRVLAYMIQCLVHSCEPKLRHSFSYRPKSIAQGNLMNVAWRYQ